MISSLPLRSVGRVSLVLLLAGLLASCGPAYRGEPLYGPHAFSDPRVVEGERVFAAQCHECHPGGDAGLGFAINNRPLPGWAIALQVRTGIGAMPSFDEERLSDEELDAVIAYLMELRSLQPSRAR